MGTALVYHEDMTAARLLWDDPECELERPERLAAALGLLRRRGLERRCRRLSAAEASEAELALVHSPEYVALVRGTQALDEGELQALSRRYDAVYFHPSTYHCARLAVGAALQLVDAVLTGTVHNGLALVRPPGHHSQRAVANGFCVFNNVAIAAKHAKQKYGLHRILIVDWDIHHGQGIQYIFEDDPRWGWEMLTTWLPSCMSCSRWPSSLTRSWCWSQQDLTQPLGTLRVRCKLHLNVLPTLHSCCTHWLEAGFVLCWSALESIQRVRAAQAPHWTSLQQDRGPTWSPSTRSPEGQPLPLLPESSTYEAAGAVLNPPLDLLALHTTSTPAIRMAVALTGLCATLALPPEVLLQEGSLGREETEAWARPHETLAQDKAFSALGQFLFLLDGILDGKVTCGIAATSACARAPTLDVAIRRSLSRGAQRLLCLALGELDWPLDLDDDGRILWLNIGGKKAAVWSTFHISIPLPGTTGGLLNCILGLVLPLAYSFQPELVLVAVGPAHGLQEPHVALLAAMLRVPAAGRVLVLLEEESAPQLVRTLSLVLRGEAPPSLGPFLVASPEDTQALTHLRVQLEPLWKLLQVASAPQGT
ncbi:polyamine deacetylase HDAC10 isoform 3-T3 [Thomomys bottae]